ncbi:hypothetical protein [Pseudoduganella armeniaca]|uniref:Uncharacterized protein n=1 Tax=Pseudoduganella armeniaca TaxID=2072590 RepID=A0A2R4CFV0_9BURK|nr:hypothetical protein [Pseudoduganella armeniaca]AVR98360.1 hypothetical protein C9I28_24000 [Pseudoduganella armeniaca]
MMLLVVVDGGIIARRGHAVCHALAPAVGILLSRAGAFRQITASTLCLRRRLVIDEVLCKQFLSPV